MSRKRSNQGRGLALFAVLTALAVALRALFKRIRRNIKTREAREQEHTYLATTSDREHCDIEGLRYLAGALSPETLKEVTGEECLSPIRIYAGIRSGDTPEERVNWALDEMDVLDAWSRKVILVIAPTGRGYVHPIPMEVCEIAHRGDHAGVAIQYADDRSMRAIGKLDDGIQSHILLLNAIRERCLVLAQEGMHVPRIHVYGESMGAWASLEAMLDCDKLPDRALWVGSPRPVRVKTLKRVQRRIQSSEGYYLEGEGAPSGLTPYYSLVNGDDPIVHFEGMRTMVFPSRWARRNSKLWLPGLTWAKILLEIDAQTRPEHGVLGQSKHDYRGHMASTIPLVYGGQSLSTDQVQWLREREANRKRDFAFLYTLPVNSS
jgi:hypothetical protein